jgi:hypothetical protein
MQITSCYNSGSASVCSAAQNNCNNNILSPLSGVWDADYILAANPDPYPPDLTNYLDEIQTTIGAEIPWKIVNDNVYSNFAATGDWMHNSRTDLLSVIDTGVSL